MSSVSKVHMTPQGPQISSLVQGYWRMAEWGRNTQQHLRFLEQHMELGITTVDHAHVYGEPPCETLFGDVLKLAKPLRESIQIITKCGIELVSPANADGKVNHYNCAYDNIVASVDLSLARLNTDFIDVLLIHRPDYLLDADEVARAFERLYADGKVRHFGVSNFKPEQFSLLQSRLDRALVTNQVEINPLNMAALEDGTLDQLQTLRVRPMAWSCLAGGRFFNDQSAAVSRTKTVLSKVADEIGADSFEQVLYAWALRLPSKPIPIIGSGKIERVKSAVTAMNLKLSREQWYRIWVAAKGHGVP